MAIGGSLGTSNRVFLMYLGKRGGGANLLMETSLGLQIEGIPHEIIISNRFENSLIDKISAHKNDFLVPHSIFEIVPFGLVLVLKVLFFVRKLKKNSSVTQVVVIMPQVLDLIFLKILKRFIDVRVTYLIHEIHGRGKLPWPTENAIKRRINISNAIITFNLNLHKFVGSISAVDRYLMPLQARNYFQEDSNFHSEKRGSYLLWVGRNDSYKGLSTLLEAWKQVGKNSSYKLLVAGIGVKSVEKLENIEVVSRWLSDAEIWSLVRHASYVILPYINSTQSGILAMANAENIAAIITPVSELLEQSKEQDLVLRDFSVSSLVEKLEQIEILDEPRNSRFSQEPTDLVQFIAHLSITG